MGYTMHIVGEQHYQEAIAASEANDPITVAHEVGNPHDNEALVVINAQSGRTLGYLPRDSFVHRLVFEEGKSVTGQIESIFDREGYLEIKVHVEIEAQEAAPKAAYRPAARNPTPVKRPLAPTLSDFRAPQSEDETPAKSNLGCLVYGALIVIGLFAIVSLAG